MSRTIDLNAPFDYGKAHADKPIGKVPLRYLRNLSKGKNADAAQYAVLILKARGAYSEPETAPTVQESTNAPEQATAPARSAPVKGGVFTLVYRNRLLLFGLGGRRNRTPLDRGETVRLTTDQYSALGDNSKLALVKGELSADQVTALVTKSKGQIPGAREAKAAKILDFANALPVKDAGAKSPASTLNAPNFVPMDADDVRAWAHAQKPLGLSFADDARKNDMVAEINKALAQYNKSPEETATPGGDLEDV